VVKHGADGFHRIFVLAVKLLEALQLSVLLAKLLVEGFLKPILVLSLNQFSPFLVIGFLRRGRFLVAPLRIGRGRINLLLCRLLLRNPGITLGFERIKPCLFIIGCPASAACPVVTAPVAAPSPSNRKRSMMYLSMYALHRLSEVSCAVCPACH
jgi:hypothetical protein